MTMSKKPPTPGKRELRDVPEDELNRVTQAGQHFGFPFCHQGNVSDSEYGWGHSCEEFVPPVALLGPHSASLGMRFYTGDMFPPEYKNVAFIARHGSWNREQKFGYDVAIARTNGDKATVEPFLTGLLNNEKNEFYGRPAYVFQLKDGSLLVSDETNGATYRISYEQKKAEK